MDSKTYAQQVSEAVALHGYDSPQVQSLQSQRMTAINQAYVANGGAQATIGGAVNDTTFVHQDGRATYRSNGNVEQREYSTGMHSY